MSQQDATEPIWAYPDPVQSLVEKLVDSIPRSIGAEDFDAVNEIGSLIIRLAETRDRRDWGVSPPIAAELKNMRADLDNIHKDMDKMGQKLTSFLRRGNYWARMIPLFLVAVAIVAYPFYGMVTHMAPQSLVQYLTPVSGLAGAIIGYWFGQQGDGS